MPIQQVIHQGRVPVKIYTDDVDPKAIDQLLNVAQLPFVHSHVAAMPDVHVGIGATVGAVIPTKGAIIPAAVGVDIGCFLGDTKIPLLNGMERTLRELAEQGGECWVYAIDAQQMITGARAVARLTRRDAPIMRVVLDNDAEVLCTPDHRFMLRDGSWREARDLQPKTSLMPFYSPEILDVAVDGNQNRQFQSRELLDQCADVYCLTVPGYENFALSAGVFVHNCGMNAVRLSLKAGQLPDSLRPVRYVIEAAVPVGFDMHPEGRGASASAIRALSGGLDLIVKKHPGILKMQKNVERTWGRQLGTLGGGNHFIELCLDENDDVWVMLHSGSRGIGNIIGRYFIELARKDMGKHLANLPDRDLAYLQEGAEHFDDYVAAVQWAQDYAMTNRREMMRLILEALARQLPPFTLTREAINCHHNYVVVEHHFGEDLFVTRKGAIRAGVGELGIIPGSMGARSYIVRGKGEPDSFCSCAHGAGRRMSRGQAKKKFDPQDLIAQTAGVECRKDAGVLDEIPGAYKPIDEVMANQADLVEVVHTLKQVVCVKG